ncbi:hypothetical protein EPO15_16050 [bacterium]|nr:MAG: hypothetical protein EPO15_16050 [bacterium]
MGKEFLMVALLALFSDVVVPRVTELTAAKAAPQAEEGAEEPSEEAGEEATEEEPDADEVERLREENRALKELVGEKELALRQAAD